jgi:predicted P-loop ATPase
MMGEKPITPATMVDISHWFGGTVQIFLNSLALLEKCVEAQCEKQPRDLLKHWLNALPPWDGTKRLDTWLIDIAGAADEAYTRHVSRRLVLSLVARAIDPGCQYRQVIILEGPQNVGKSHLLQALASREWYVEMSMNLETKESHMMLQSAWLAELSELDSMNRTEKARLKAFITMDTDTYVPKYRNGAVSYPRRSILVGTTNDMEYLTDFTGNDRFLPLWTPGPIAISALRDIREQLFAEALQAYNEAGDTWWHTPEDVAKDAAWHQDQRRITSEWHAPLEAWLGIDRFTHSYYEDVYDPQLGQMVNRRVEFQEGVTSWEEIARWFLTIEKREGWRDNRLTNPILNCLRAMGWKRGKRTRTDGETRTSHWYKPGHEPAEDEKWGF